MEWAPVRAALQGHAPVRTPFGEAVPAFVGTSHGTKSVVYVHGSWGKISAAASTQYAIDRWKPALLVNIGTCGGFEGRVKAGDVILVTKTVTYDILEQMGDAAEAIRDYTTEIDLSWLKRPYPTPVIESVLVSGDRDLVPADIPKLAASYGAVAGDWESSAIAFTAGRNATPVLILRAVSDVVGAAGSEAYGNVGLFERRASEIMTGLMKILPAWLDAASGLPGL
jgi:adenosylhomocysteine nucleosidase